MKYSALHLRLLALAAMSLCSAVRADVVTDWSSNLDQVIIATAQAVPPQARYCAIVHTAMYDAINGIVGTYRPYFVTEPAPAAARPDAAGIAAAYTTMASLYPAQKTNLDLMYSNSLQRLGADTNSPAIASGLAWGQHVANLVLAFRANDGFNTTPTPYFGGGAAGVWRSPPSGASGDGTLPAVFPQLATLVPFAMTNHAQFRPGPPPALTSAQYAADVNEVQLIGRVDSATRTSDQTQIALLWQAVGTVDENRIVRSVATATNSLVDNARLFALVNIAAADAVVAAFDSKYTYNLWRPYHAIRLGDTNSNPALSPDPSWNCLFVPPRFQEYMSAHAVLTGAIMRTLAGLLGNNHSFTLTAPGYPNFTWNFTNFTDATAQVKEARIWAGIHFRNSCNVGEMQGTNIANYVLANFLGPVSNAPAGVVNPALTYAGKTYGDWAAAWWEWAYGLESTHHPLTDTADLSAGQSGPVWFLGGQFSGTKPLTRTGVVPAGTALFFPIVNLANDNFGCPAPTSFTPAQLLSVATPYIDGASNLACLIDGVPVGPYPYATNSPYRVSTTNINYAYIPPNNNLIESAEGDTCYADTSAAPTPWTLAGAVADGVYVLLAPLAPGAHTIHFTGAIPGLGETEDVTYQLTVTDTNLGNPNVFPPESAPYGKTYAQWSQAHWQWVYSLPADRNPLFDTSDVSAGQSGNVWFLGGTYATVTATNGVMRGTATRNVTIPQDKALFFPLIDTEASVAEGNGTNFGQLFAAAQAQIDQASNLSCTIDGQAIQNLNEYRTQSGLFQWGPLPANNVFGDSVHFPAGATSQGAADGYYLMLKPLSPGDHSLHFTGGVPGFQLDITYNITVTPTNGVYPPGTILYGNTYSEWFEKFCQYYLALPFNSNPFHYDPANPAVPLGVGQSGPVWFVHGWRNRPGSYSRNDTIPAGTSLLIVAVQLGGDNTACPFPTTYAPSELLATASNYVNTATNMSVKVDGISVADLSNASTTPYRTQAIFDYTMPASNNLSYASGETCYSNNQGIPYVVEGAAADGVALLIPPLSPGHHTITYQLKLPLANFQWTMTENITVLSNTPALALAHQPGSLSLTWPQSALNYTVESTSTLNPPHWQPASLPIQTVEGSYKVTAPVGTNAEFFRLRKH